MRGMMDDFFGSDDLDDYDYDDLYGFDDDDEPDYFDDFYDPEYAHHYDFGYEDFDIDEDGHVVHLRR